MKKKLISQTFRLKKICEFWKIIFSKQKQVLILTLARLVKLALKAAKMAHGHAINAIFSIEQWVQAIFLLLMVTYSTVTTWLDKNKETIKKKLEAKKKKRFLTTLMLCKDQPLRVVWQHRFRFDSRAVKIGHSVANGSPPLRLFFRTVLARRWAAKVGLVPRYMLQVWWRFGFSFEILRTFLAFISEMQVTNLYPVHPRNWLRPSG